MSFQSAKSGLSALIWYQIMLLTDAHERTHTNACDTPRDADKPLRTSNFWFLKTLKYVRIFKYAFTYSFLEFLHVVTFMMTTIFKKKITLNIISLY